MTLKKIRDFTFENTIVQTAAGGYVLTNEACLIVNKTIGGATPVTLPATPAQGRSVIVKDGKGDAASNNITVSPAAGTIDGAVNQVIALNFGAAIYTYNGTEWGLTSILSESGSGDDTVTGSLTVNGAFVANENGTAVNSRIESDGNANMIFVDGTNNRVGIGTATPAQVLDVNGTVAAPTVNAGASGVTGTVQVFPTTAARGKVALTTSANTGDTITAINVAAQAGAVTYTIPDAAASASFVLLATPQGTAGRLVRADLLQESLVIHPVPLTEARQVAVLSAGIPAADDATSPGLVNGTYLTSNPSIQTNDVKAAGAQTRNFRFLYPVPEHYVAGQPVTVSVNAGMTTTIADTTATLAVDVARQAAPSVNIGPGGTVTINSLTAGAKTFSLTATSIVVGDVLDVRVTLAINDAATATAVIGTVNTISMLLATKG